MQGKNRVLFVCVLSFVLVSAWGCQTVQQSFVEMKDAAGIGSKSNPDEITEPRLAEKNLSEREARFRARRIEDVHYDLSFQLDREKTEFTGAVTADFKYRALDSSRPLTIDFSGGNVLSLRVNDQRVDRVDYNGFFLSIDPEQLVEGQNRVRIEFSRPYSQTGDGLYRFRDPEDRRVYLYTDFEPYDANKLFPCFDQPDIKATYQLDVEVPRNWEVITSVFESKKLRRKRNRTLWKFPKSARFSTYIFSLHAGPYQVWRDKKGVGENGKIPIRLLARRSLARYVDSQEWLELTRKGFAFFETYFDYPYPYTKYDQVIVPDFNSGAMENVGAVTFSERYVYRGEVTKAFRERRANTILHELAHMWFGNLVTMRWWDDLWLNESFATYMAHLALHEATDYKNVWKSFYSGAKQWAYWEDQLVTTHPIAVPVEDTDQAFAHFDGITYGKGASVLKQVNFYIRPERFQEGVRKYFKTHAEKNTELKDFMGALQETTDEDLETWTESWLKTPSLNTIEAKFTCSEGKVSAFSLVQTASDPKYPRLRSHRTQVALYEKDETGAIVLGKVVPVTYRGPETSVAELVGESCPAMVYPNHEDYDYVKVRLDSGTLKTAQASLSNLQDSMARLMVWQSLWDMVRDGELSLLAYADLVLNHLPKEKEYKIAAAVSYRLYRSVRFYLPREGERSVAYRKSFSERLETFFWKQLKASEPGSDFQKLWFGAYVASAQTKKAQSQLSKTLKGQIRFPKLKMDQDRRWRLVLKLNQLDAKNAASFLKREIARDASERGQKMALAAKVVRPSLEVKRRWFNELVSPDSKLSLGRMQAVMRYLFPADQERFRTEFEGEFFSQLPRLALRREEEFTRGFSRSLVPAFCRQGSIDRLGQFIQQHGNMPAIVLKNLKVAKQEDERCLKVRSLALREIEGEQSLDRAEPSEAGSSSSVN